MTECISTAIDSLISDINDEIELSNDYVGCSMSTLGSQSGECILDAWYNIVYKLDDMCYRRHSAPPGSVFGSLRCGLQGWINATIEAELCIDRVMTSTIGMAAKTIVAFTGAQIDA